MYSVFIEAVRTEMDGMRLVNQKNANERWLKVAMARNAEQCDRIKSDATASKTMRTDASREEESREEKEEGAKAPSKKSKKEKIPPAFPDEVKESAREIAKSTPKEDPQGRKIKINPALLLERLSICFKENSWLTPDIAIGAWKTYIATEPEWVKAPHYFFGKQEDQKNGANWYPYAHLIWNRKPKVERLIEVPA